MAIPFDVLAEPSRRQILDLLLERPRLVGELTEELGLTQPGTSKHLRVLREAGLVRVRVDAQRRWYELCPEPLAEVDAWLAPYRRLWTDRLDALERHLDTLSDGAGTPGADADPVRVPDVPDAPAPQDAPEGEEP
ncbi:metalloregulator ArsR/SmtB family transcription factor [Streptomyces sp. NPDC048636]|uniref:ArsR/SmtB family transcription factor n=1 Tax=Streptomyces sp. NPDC048636 TaxID=3155762 RepID=UPI00343F0D25